MVRSFAIIAKGPGSIPGWGAKILQTVQQKIKKKQSQLEAGDQDSIYRYLAPTVLF